MQFGGLLLGQKKNHPPEIGPAIRLDTMGHIRPENREPSFGADTSPAIFLYDCRM